MLKTIAALGLGMVLLPGLAAAQAGPGQAASQPSRTSRPHSGAAESSRIALPYYQAEPARILRNLDSRAHELELTCDQAVYAARVEAKAQASLAAPVQPGCSIKIVGSSRTITLEPGYAEIVIKGGVAQQLGQALEWRPVLKTYGNVSAWPKGLKRQWARSATASSEYSNPQWSASQAAGAPQLAECADNVSAWATKDVASSEPEWIELRYASKVRAVGVRLHVNLSPGAVREIKGKTGSGWETLWQGKDPTASCPAVLELKFVEEIDTDTIRVVLDTSHNTSWFELDAVELLGKGI